MNTERLLSKPLIGGPFGAGRYALASVPIVDKGFHGVQFMVIDPRAGSVLSVAADKTQALADARRVIGAAGELSAAHDERLPKQAPLWREEELPPIMQPAPAVAVSRRRREIFERTLGKCFYCASPLQLTGPWHVEHQMPRALGGSDGALNLVAACERCNLRKADRTALEFIVGKP